MEYIAHNEKLPENIKRQLGDDNILILNLLGRIANDYDEILRLVGGAPRDIIMRKTNINDLDLTIEKMSGKEFTGIMFLS